MNKILRIFQYTKGVPRLVNGLCDRALLTGYVNDTPLIEAAVIDEVAAELPALTREPATAASEGAESS